MLFLLSLTKAQKKVAPWIKPKVWFDKHSNLAMKLIQANKPTREQILKFKGAFHIKTKSRIHKFPSIHSPHIYQLADEIFVLSRRRNQKVLNTNLKLQ